MFLRGIDGFCLNIFYWMVVLNVIFFKLKEWIGGANIGIVSGDFF